jgi:hypothetical protein
MIKRRTKTNLKDFELFISECKKWIKFLELNRWDVIYYHKSSKGDPGWSQAGTQVFTDSHAEILFDTEWDIEDITVENIKNAAKHEVMHLLLGNIRNNVHQRFLTEREVCLAEEEVVRILVKKLN